MSQSPVQSCTICAESYNKKVRAPVTCPYCMFEACACCCQQFLVSESTTTPRCMNNDCRREWTRRFIAETFTAAFVNKRLKEHREKVIYDRERALMPTTQPIVENILATRRTRQELRDINDQIRALLARKTEVNRRLLEVYAHNRGATHTTRERRQFTHACASPDCRGFLSTQWKCGLCEQWTCPECYELKGGGQEAPEHTCHPDQVASAQLMRSDTRPCPTCGIGIYRVSGCPQMFCTQCNTAFCWTTGQVETQNIHNPHYFEWLRRTGGNAAPAAAGGNPCRDRTINHAFALDMTSKLRSFFKHSPDKPEKPLDLPFAQRVFAYVTGIVHLHQIVTPTYHTNLVNSNQDLRVKYLMNKIDETQLKTALQRCDKRVQKNQEIHAILTMTNDTVTDILHRLLKHLKNYRPVQPFAPHFDEAENMLDEIDRLADYVNECFADISKHYHSKLLKMNHMLRMDEP